MYEIKEIKERVLLKNYNRSLLLESLISIYNKKKLKDLLIETLEIERENKSLFVNYEILKFIFHDLILKDLLDPMFTEKEKDILDIFLWDVEPGIEYDNKEDILDSSGRIYTESFSNQIKEGIKTLLKNLWAVKKRWVKS